MSRGFGFQSFEDRMETYEDLDRNPVTRTLGHLQRATLGGAIGSLSGDPKIAIEGAKAGWRLSKSLSDYED